ncbi:hypothetical protein L6164_037413 [Bauhinia variegata]|uniref:Uncharacterized protein n=1 Tax=Bauhinia variegata TaxID=167791 RepID=A0ACB9KK50_BAUVA|nr:hypothetical protein L6164_037413 [Bauhinia variegata]
MPAIGGNGGPGERSGGSHRGGVIFLLNDLPFDPDDFPATVPNLSYRFENLAAIYLSPLDIVLSSMLNTTGYIRAIYVNFGPMGYYELNRNTKLDTQPAFAAQLRRLSQAGTMSSHDNNEVVWRKITDLSSLLSTLPENSRKIGCLHGAGSEEFRTYIDYISAASDEQTYVFVVGQIGNQEIHAYIDDFVKVSNYDLEASHCLSRVILEMERKWRI